MKKNTKGFTLIELLAVIVILAIIMVIAVPQLLNVIESSRKSAWKSNVELIEKGLELGKTLSDTNMTSTTFSLSDTCNNNNSGSDVTEKIKAIADISTTDIQVTCASSTSVDVKAVSNGQFKGQSTIRITCDDNGCSNNWSTVYPEK